VRQIVSGQGHSIAILTDGSLWGWGQIVNAEVGNGQVCNESSFSHFYFLIIIIVIFVYLFLFRQVLQHMYPGLLKYQLKLIGTISTRLPIWGTTLSPKQMTVRHNKNKEKEKEKKKKKIEVLT
jgi:hypothetical protein